MMIENGVDKGTIWFERLNGLLNYHKAHNNITPEDERIKEQQKPRKNYLLLYFQLVNSTSLLSILNQIESYMTTDKIVREQHKSHGLYNIPNALLI